MNINEITEGIFYVGVNDRTTPLFERLWQIPNGVSYNSYIVCDRKTALIDTVELGEAHQYLQEIERATGGRGLDYLVINHMEPDHSGCIPLIAERYPDLKIVGNGKTVEMIGGFYGLTDSDRFIVVKDGDELSLGNRTLKFYLTPMVHWPETMMTYVREQAVLFSGDAFGTFGALNGAALDRDTDCDLYLKEEVYRYYSNIVGKYGVPVQRALQKLSGLKLDFICPTHGPVWNEYIAEIVGIYDRLSRYEAEPGVVIVYGSMYGHTAEIADRIATSFAARGVKHIRVHDLSSSPLTYVLADIFRYKGLVIGSPTYSMNIFPPVEQLLIALATREVKNRVAATFGEFTWASAATKLMGAYSEKLKLDIVASFDKCQDREEGVNEGIERITAAVTAAI